MKRFKELLQKPQVKNVTLGVLVLIIGAICSSLGGWDNRDKVFYIKLGIAIVLTIIYAILLVYYSTWEVNELRVRKILESKVKAFETLMVGIVSICKQSSDDVTTIVHCMVEEGTVNLKIWNFDKACTWVCQQIYNLLMDLSEGVKDFGVAYVKLEEGVKPEREIQMNAFANQNMQKPSVYKKKRRIDGDKDTDYYDVDLFRKGKSDIEIIIGKEKIDEAFSYLNKESRRRNRGKYNQYIAIPVFCNDIKMVGLLEIVCLNEASLGKNESEVLEVVSKYFVPYSFLILLLHKLEKALIAKPCK